MFPADMAHISVEREVVKPISVSKTSRCNFRGCSKSYNLTGVLRLGLNVNGIVSFFLVQNQGNDNI